MVLNRSSKASSPAAFPALMLTPENQQVLCRCLADLRTLERLLIETLELQEHEKDLQTHRDAAKLLAETLDLLRYQVARLDEELEALHCDPRAALKASAGSFAAAFAATVSKLRSHEASKILRDDYTMLNLAAVAYTMLHTTAVAIGHSHLADLSLIHLRELTGVLFEINHLLPRIVVEELGRTTANIAPGVAEKAWQNVEEAWGRPVVIPAAAS